MLKWLKKLTGGKWTTKYTVEYVIQWTDLNNREETITFFLKENERGDRDYSHHAYGFAESHRLYKNYEAEMILWKETGLLPKRAKSVILEKLSR